MSRNKILIGRLVLPETVIWGGLWIRDDKIAGILSPDALEAIHEDTSETARSIEMIDHGNAFLMPGLIEAHGHLGEPGLTEKEDYLTGTKAAVAGGVTTVLDMPNTNPPNTTIETLRLKEASTANRAYADYAFIFGTTPDNQRELRKVSPNEVVGVKFFMAGSDSTPTTMTNIGDLYASLRTVKEKGLVPLFHAENQQLINRLVEEAKITCVENQTEFDGPMYSATRNPLAARLAVAEALELTAALDMPAYLCHISTREELQAIKTARQRGATVYAEAAGYHLLFSVDDYERLGAFLKASPPVREAEEREALWGALLDGTISTLASEHSPQRYEEKEKPMAEAAAGMPGLQENLPMLFSAFLRRDPKKPVEEIMHLIARLGSTNVAQIFGLSNKGALAAGKDADVVVFDTNRLWTLTEDMLYSKCGWSVYVGESALGKPMYTYLRGEIVQQDGQIVGNPRGKQIRRSAS